MSAFGRVADAPLPHPSSSTPHQVNAPPSASHPLPIDTPLNADFTFLAPQPAPSTNANHLPLNADALQLFNNAESWSFGTNAATL